MTTRALPEVLTGLYASEINCGVQSFWDAGWQAWIGDDWNKRAAEGVTLEFDEVAQWLHENALRLYPDSAYAKAHA